MDRTKPNLLRFGGFEVDLRAQEIRRRGRKLKLGGQPFQVLALLLEKPGDVVTREEFRQRLWSSDTFVDFDNGINIAIKSLRQTLGDSAESPNFIETLPRVGYRFIGTVEEKGLGVRVNQAQPASLSAERPLPPIEFVSRDVAAVPKLSEEVLKPVLVGSAPLNMVPSPDVKPSWWHGWHWIVLAAFVMLAGEGAWLYVRWHRTRVLTEKDAIVLADFVNRTGDSVFDDGLRPALAAKLEESPFLNVVPDRKMASTLRLMGRPTDTKVTVAVAREICVRTGSKAMVSGSIAQIGSHYLLSLEASNCAEGGVLGRSEQEAASKDQVVGALGAAGSDLRRRLGESIPSLRHFNRPLAEATTSSLEALQAYSLARRALIERGTSATIPFLKRATELDPQFALAYERLGIGYYNLAELGQTAENLKKAYELRDRVTERERFSIVSSYYQMATGQQNKAQEVFDVWVQTYPRDAVAHAGLGALYGDLGQYEKSAAETIEATRLEPDLEAGAYGNLMDDYLCMNRLDAAKATYEEAVAHKVDNSQIHDLLYLLAFLKNDQEGMARELAWAAGRPGVEDVLLANQASTEAFYGRMKRSREFSRRAVQSAKLAEENEAAASWEATEALDEALVGNATEARQQAAASLKLASNRDIQATAAMAFAQSGDLARARQMADDLVRRQPLDTLAILVYAPIIRAQVDIERTEFAKAIAELEPEAPYDLSTPQGLLPLYPVYVRAEAYLRAGRGAEAATEFQRILDHQGIVVNVPVGALAHLGVARAYTLQATQAPGNITGVLKQQARAAYRDFLILWKQADAEVPVLVQAKTEYAKLQ